MALLIGFCWGFFEGTWFFFIPDIALSFFALKGIKHAIYGTLATIIGAMCAAIFLYFLFEHYPKSLEALPAFWSHLPGYYEQMFDVARTHLHESGAKGLLEGPKSGIPYRFFLLESFKDNISLINVLIWTPLARLERIVIAPIACLILRYFSEFVLIAKFSLPRKKVYFSLHCLIFIYWCAIYYWYWFLFLPNTYR
jgi:hypothetical protein